MKKALSEREKAAVLKLDAAAVEAQERITKAAEKAQVLIDRASNLATEAIEKSSRIPDKRNLDGSYQWDRGDRYRRGSDNRIQRLEDKVNGEKVDIGGLQVGQAKREEQIIGLIEDVARIQEVEKHIQRDYENFTKDINSRMVTQRELILDIRDTFQKEIAAYKSRNLWQLVLVLATAMTTIIFVIVNKFVQI